jgi:hypothetical protein
MRVMLCTPTLFRIPALEYMMSVIKTQTLLAQYGHVLDTCFVGGDAFIMKARNGLVQSFIETWKTEYAADVLLFIDDDQSWDAEAVLRHILDPHELIAAAVPKKMDTDDGGMQTFNNVMLDTDANGQCYVEGGLLRCSQIGSGYLVIKKSMIEKLMKAYPQRYAPGDGGLHQLHYCFFESKVMWDEKNPDVVGQFWGEDLVFCKKVCAMGERIWLDPNVSMTHVGRKTWVGNFLEFLQKHTQVELKKTETPVAIPETLQQIERLAA